MPLGVKSQLSHPVFLWVWRASRPGVGSVRVTHLVAAGSIRKQSVPTKLDQAFVAIDTRVFLWYDFSDLRDATGHTGEVHARVTQ